VICRYYTYFGKRHHVSYAFEGEVRVGSLKGGYNMVNARIVITVPESTKSTLQCGCSLFCSSSAKTGAPEPSCLPQPLSCCAVRPVLPSLKVLSKKSIRA
jgi:hypothetical protein